MDAFTSPREVARTLFRRCVQCPSTTPSCPSCPAGQVCSLVPVSCNQCPYTTCVSATTLSGAAPSNTPAPQPSEAGPIAGGVIGGIVLIAVAVFLVWWFCIRGRRREYQEGRWQDDYNMGSEKDTSEFMNRRSNRQSTHTVASVASSAFTRASNFIPIAYIPGVTNRSAHSSQDLVPPMPPIPAASSGASQLDGEDNHYFLPHNLHDTSYGGAGADRNSMARTSIASTIYRNNAIVSPVPAQMISRAKPTAVSVRSNGKNSPSMSRSNTPPVPNVPTAKSLTAANSSIVGRVAVPRSVQIKKSSSLRKMQHIYELDGSDSGSIASRTHIAAMARRPSDVMSPTSDAGDSDDEQGARQRLMSMGSTGIGSPSELSDYSAIGHKPSNNTLNQIIEEATAHASGDVMQSRGGLGVTGHDIVSPFSDAHAAHTP